MKFWVFRKMETTIKYMIYVISYSQLKREKFFSEYIKLMVNTCSIIMRISQSKCGPPNVIAKNLVNAELGETADH